MTYSNPKISPTRYYKIQGSGLYQLTICQIKSIDLLLIILQSDDPWP